MKHILLHTVFIASCAIWLLLAHVQGWIGCALLVLPALVCVLYYYQMRSKWNRPALAAKKASTLLAVILTLDVIGTLVIVGLAFAAFAMWGILGVPTVLSAALLWIISVWGYARLAGSVSAGQLRALQIGVYAACVAVAVAAILTFERLGMGLNPTIRTMVITGILAVCMASYLRWQTDYGKELRRVICIVSLALSFALTITLNWRLGQSGYVSHSYQAIGKPYKDSVTCILDDGRRFTYLHCPVTSGKVGHVYQTNGWFQIQYLMRPNDTLVK